MSETNVTVVKFLFHQEWKMLDDALAGPPPYEVENLITLKDLMSVVSMMEASLVIVSLREKDDLLMLANVVKNSKSFSKNNAFKFLIVNFTGHKQFEKALAKLGINDIIEPNINLKALRFKVDFLVKALKVQAKKTAASNESAKQQDQKSADQLASDKKGLDQVSWIPPIECEDDIWLLLNDSDCKRVLTRWMVKTTGPGPYVGQWVDVPENSGAWRFEFKPEFEDQYMSEGGTWYFRGTQKPDFVWKENIWLITGEKFELFWQKDDQKITRLKLHDRALTIAQNSEYAKTKEAIIGQSFNRDITFKQEGAKQSDSHIEIQDASLNTRMTGRISETDRDKAKAAAGGHQYTDEVDSFWGGKKKSGALDRESDEDSYDYAAAKKKKASTAAETDDADDDGLMPDHKKKSSGNSTIDSEMSGKSSTDTLSGLYKNKTKQHEEAGLIDDPKRRSAKADQLSGHMGGKLKGAASETQAAEPNDGWLDELMGPLNGELKGAAPEDSGNDPFEGVTDQIAGYLGGKSQLGQGEAGEQKRPYEGKTDQLAGYMGGKSRIGEGNSDDDGPSLEETIENLAATSRNRRKSQTGNSTPAAEGSLLSLEEAKARKQLQQEHLQNLEQAMQEIQLSSRLTQHQQNFSCELSDTFDNVMILLMDEVKIDQRHPVQLKVDIIYLGKQKKFDLEARVDAVETDGAGKQYVTIIIPENKADEVEALVDVFQERQDNINFFMQAAKGTG
jgi:hypothetical protein